MSFSLSNNVITQSGTDTDLSGLDGLSGVTTTNISGSGDFDGTVIYVLPDNCRIVVNGTVTHTAGTEILVSGEGNITNKFLEVNGVYNYGVGQTYSSKIVYPHALGLIINWAYTGSQRQFLPSTAGIYVTPSGTFNWRGANIKSARSIISEGTILISEAVFTPYSTNPSGTKNYSPRIGLRFGSAVVSDFDIYGTNGNLFGITLGDLTTLSLSKIGIDGTNFDAAALAPEPGDVTNNFGSKFLYVTDIPDLTLGNAVVTKVWQKRLIKFVNYGAGIGIISTIGERNSSNGVARGSVYCVKKVNANIVDTSGVPIVSAKVYIPEESDGNEPNNSTTTAYSAEDITFLESAVAHSELTDANGDISEVEISLYFGYKQASSNLTDNVRTKAGGLLDYSVIQYNYSILSGPINTAGVGSLDLTTTLVSDINITELDKTVADAYTSLDNANEFYDRAKSYLFDNFSGESGTIVNRSGLLIDAGGNNIVIDATASTAFAFNGSTITIHSDNFAGDLLTTGVISFVNGALTSGSYTDQNGTVSPDQQFTIQGIINGAEVRIYDNDTGLNSLGTELAGIEVNSGTSFVYIHNGATNDILVQMIASGFEEILLAITLSSNNQLLVLNPITDANA